MKKLASVPRICGFAIHVFAVLERWLLQVRETDSSLVFITFAVLLGNIESAD